MSNGRRGLAEDPSGVTGRAALSSLLFQTDVSTSPVSKDFGEPITVMLQGSQASYVTITWVLTQTYENQRSGVGSQGWLLNRLILTFRQKLGSLPFLSANAIGPYQLPAWLTPGLLGSGN